MNYTRTFFVRQPDGTYISQQQNYPQLVDMPCVIIGGGSTYLQFPIKAGDQCLVFFNDRDLSNWFAGNRTGPVATAELHPFSAGIALVGFQSVPDYDLEHALLSNGNAEVGVPASSSASQVLIGNDLTTLGETLGSLTTILTTLFTSMSSANAGNIPATIAVPSAAAVTSLAAVITQLESLLE